MGFYQDIAEALDSEGIESRFADDTLFVPITPELEIQFVQIDTSEAAQPMNAANVFVAMADVAEDDEEFEAALVGVVFSVEAAVAEVAKHVATDQIVSVLHELLEGGDYRLEELDFEQDAYEPLVVHAPVGDNSILMVELKTVDEEPQAKVTFVTYGEDFEELLEQATDELIEREGDISESARQTLFDDMVRDVGELTREILELGTFSDFDELADALALASQQAFEWEAMLVPLDDDEDFDGDDLYSDDLDDDDLDDDVDDEMDEANDGLDEDLDDEDLEDEGLDGELDEDLDDHEENTADTIAGNPREGQRPRA